MALTKKEQDELDRLELAELEAKEAQGMNPMPGTDAIGVTEGPTPAAKRDWIDKAGELAETLRAGAEKYGPKPIRIAFNKDVQNAATKILDYPAGLVRTGASQIAGMFVPGENPVGIDDWMEALQGNAKGVGDQAVRMGFPDNSVTIPGTEKKIGNKDLLNIAGGMVTDPFNYPSAFKKVGKKLYNSSIRPIEVEGVRYNKNDVGDEMFKNKISNPLNLKEKIQKIVDKNMLEVEGIEKAATRKGGQIDIEKAMDPAQAYVNKLRAGAVESEDLNLVKRLQRSIDAHKKLAGRPGQKEFIELPYTKEVEELVPQAPERGYKAAGTKVEADIDPSSNAGAQGKYYYGPNDQRGIQFKDAEDLVTTSKKPDMQWDPKKGWYSAGDEVVELSTPMAPKKVLKPAMDVGEIDGEAILSPPTLTGSRLKKKAYVKARDNAYDMNRKSTEYQNFKKAQGAGLKSETEASVGRSLSPEDEIRYRELNESTGKLLSTGKAQERVTNQAQREFDSLTSPFPNGTEGAVMSIPASMSDDIAEGVGKGALTMAIQKAMRGLKLSQMPVGYGLRSVDPKTLKQLLIINQMKYGPWARGEESGEE